jgi:hypothetical protein
MTLQVIENWVRKLPQVQQNLPILSYQGKFYTPLEILDEVRKNTPLGQALQKKIESGDPPSESELYKQRLIQAIQMYIQKHPSAANKPLVAGIIDKQPVVLTPLQLINEIQNETKIGKTLIEAEKKQVQRILSLAR